jgi:hypothetical protein
LKHIQQSSPSPLSFTTLRFGHQFAQQSPRCFPAGH